MLYLLPNLLSAEADPSLFLPSSIGEIVRQLDGLIAESVKGGRRFLAPFLQDRKPDEVPLALLNKNTPDADMDFLLEPLLEGETWGLVSDAGLPCIADPGWRLVRQARRRGVALQTVGSCCSITDALMLSGLPAQRFSFHGYVPNEEGKRKKYLKDLEKRSRQEKAVQVFIEAPYRNEALLGDALQVLDERTLLSVAWSLTSSEQGVKTTNVEGWRRGAPPAFRKQPAVFLLYSP